MLYFFLLRARSICFLLPYPMLKRKKSLLNKIPVFLHQNYSFVLTTEEADIVHVKVISQGHIFIASTFFMMANTLIFNIIKLYIIIDL